MTSSADGILTTDVLRMLPSKVFNTAFPVNSHLREAASGCRADHFSVHETVRTEKSKAAAAYEPCRQTDRLRDCQPVV